MRTLNVIPVMSNSNVIQYIYFDTAVARERFQTFIWASLTKC